MDYTKEAKNFLDVRNHRFARVAVVIPKVALGDTKTNVENHLVELRRVYEQGAQYAICPELGLTGYSLGDLFHSHTLLASASQELKNILLATRNWNMAFTVGLPMDCQGMVFNVAATCYRGKVLAITPKSYPPEYREFYELRHFARASEASFDTTVFNGKIVPFGNDVIIRFHSDDCASDLLLHTEVCEDIWVPITPSTQAALAGANVLANLSASNITIGKAAYRQQLAEVASAKNLAAQLYCAAGFGESTMDLCWDGDGYITERGALLARTPRFSLDGSSIVADIDLLTLDMERMRQSSFRQNAADNRKTFRYVNAKLPVGEVFFGPEQKVYYGLYRTIEAHPFVPAVQAERDERCEEVFNIQATALARRLENLNPERRNIIIGISGGQDSTHALLVAVHAVDLLKLPRSNIIGVTMPGFGTTDRTYDNACALIKAVGATFKEVSIKELSELMFNNVGYDPDQGEKGVLFENTQAWGRMYTLFATAAKEKGMVLGTGDLSELALGWTTMFGDHAAHYNVNAGVAKTLITYLIGWAREKIFVGEDEVQKVLADILDTPISPELLPPGEDGNIVHKTEEIVGPYELHDFFLYYSVRFGLGPSRVARMAYQAFKEEYTLGEIKKWLRFFIVRFFTNQFKRNCLPEGPKVGLTCLSPRGDWRMPSDASPEIWLAELETVPDSLDLVA